MVTSLDLQSLVNLLRGCEMPRLDWRHLTRFGTLAVVVSALLGIPPSSSATAPDNTWEVLSPTPMARWEPATFYDCSRTVVSANPVGRAFAGSVYGNGQIFFWGGAHRLSCQRCGFVRHRKQSLDSGFCNAPVPGASLQPRDISRLYPR